MASLIRKGAELENSSRDCGGSRPGGLPNQRHLPQPQPVASGTACEMCVLLGHAVVAPRGPPVCGCVRSGELVGKQSVLCE